MRARNIKFWKILALLPLAFMLAGCDADSPTEPPPQTGGSTPPVNDTASWTISVSTNPNDFSVGATAQVLVTISAQDSATGQRPPQGATAILTATSGTYIANTSNTSTSQTLRADGSLVAPLSNGSATATLDISGLASATAITVQAQLEQSFGQAGINITTPPPPPPGDVIIPTFIETVSPNTGPPAGGTRVRINGTGFEEPARVFFGALPGIVQSVTSERIIVETPAIELAVGAIQAVAVQVQSGIGGENPGTDSLANAFTYTRGGDGGGGGGGDGGGGGGGVIQPQIVSLTPTSGPNEGGTEVTIFGEGFGTPVQVFFGSAARIEAQVVDVTPTRVVALTPSATGFNSGNLNSLVDVQVVNVSSGLSATLSGAFQYGFGGTGDMRITSLAPGQGPYTGGQLVTLFGQGFDDPMSASLASYAVDVISVSGTEVVVRTPFIDPGGCGDVTGASVLGNIETGESATGPEYIFQVFDPVVGGISPSSIEVDSSGNPTTTTTATITGSGFENFVTVDIDSRSAFNTQVSGGTITFDVPPFTGTFPTETCENDGERDLPIAVDLTVTNNVSTCTVTLTQRFTYVPADTSCRDASPQIVDISPDTGPEAGGVSVTITGRNFDDPAEVEIDARTVSANVTSTVPENSSLNFTLPAFTGTFNTEDCILPDGTTGARNVPTAVDVTVTNIVDGKTDSRTGGFVYEPADITCVGDTTAPPPPPPPPPPPAGPVASFTASTTFGSTIVNFTSTSTGATSWLWTFPAGTLPAPPTSTLENPSGIDFVAVAFCPGSTDVPVTLEVSDGVNTDSVTQNVTIDC